MIFNHNHNKLLAYEPVQVVHTANQGRKFTSKNKLFLLILIVIHDQVIEKWLIKKILQISLAGFFT